MAKNKWVENMVYAGDVALSYLGIYTKGYVNVQNNRLEKGYFKPEEKLNIINSHLSLRQPGVYTNPGSHNSNFIKDAEITKDDVEDFVEDLLKGNEVGSVQLIKEEIKEIKIKIRNEVYRIYSINPNFHRHYKAWGSANAWAVYGALGAYLIASHISKIEFLSNTLTNIGSCLVKGSHGFGNGYELMIGAAAVAWTSSIVFKMIYNNWSHIVGCKKDKDKGTHYQDYGRLALNVAACAAVGYGLSWAVSNYVSDNAYYQIGIAAVAALTCFYLDTTNKEEALKEKNMFGDKRAFDKNVLATNFIENTRQSLVKELYEAGVEAVNTVCTVLEAGRTAVVGRSC